MSRLFRAILVACLLVGGVGPAPVLATSQSDPVDCVIDNLSPSVPAGADATYVVHLYGGLGSYGVAMSYGDNLQDTRSVTGTSTTFTHWFAAAGTYAQTVTVSGAGSSATCRSSTTVY
jgi:hypothetical protein